MVCGPRARLGGSEALAVGGDSSDRSYSVLGKGIGPGSLATIAVAAGSIVLSGLLAAARLQPTVYRLNAVYTTTSSVPSGEWSAIATLWIAGSS